MSGHSKWSTIRHRKGAQDAKRGKLFSKFAKEIMVAAKLGGGDPVSNVRLRAAVLKAKAASMPSKNIDNAINKATVVKDAAQFQELIYEGYGPDGVAIMVECLTDNKNRTVAAVRSVFSKHGGGLGQTGSVGWQFKKKGVLLIEKAAAADEDALLEQALAAGAEDLLVEADGYTILTTVEEFTSVAEKLRAAELVFASAELSYFPKNYTQVSQVVYEQIQRLTTRLDDLEDVQTVASNEQLMDD